MGVLSYVLMFKFKDKICEFVMYFLCIKLSFRACLYISRCFFFRTLHVSYFKRRVNMYSGHLVH